MKETDRITISCPFCHAAFRRSPAREQERPLIFCTYCGTKLHLEAPTPHAEEAPFLLEKPPAAKDILGSVGRFQLLRSIGKGGMGEIFLAYDTTCGRLIALKRIRADLIEHPQLQKRFLREARLTSQLAHPAIIPIYTIENQGKIIYYCMPYVEGKTLKLILKLAREQEKRHRVEQSVHTSIPFLIRQFLQVCHAVAYAHSKGILHRDLKPENIIVGKYGQVVILDWGLAQALHQADDEHDPTITPSRSRSEHFMTLLGKVVGTISYMPPERALGHLATVQSDIYSLGVILYQILTLYLPFKRKGLADFKRNWASEQLIPPEIMAPYREVPQALSEVVKKCLAPDPRLRYQSVDALIISLENYLEGRPEWFFVRTLDVHKKADWQFQEHILLAEHTAITRTMESPDWVILMISKESFTQNIRLQARVCIGQKSQGVGFLLSIPEEIDRKHLTEGYCLWLAADGLATQTTKLLRSSVSVLEAPDVVLTRGEWHTIDIEKSDQYLTFSLDGTKQFSYVSHVPVVGTHVGVLERDADILIEDLSIYVASPNIMVNCLAVPDAFLASRDYARALSEYRRIGTSFPGRAEGREARFRAGVTLLEQARTCPDRHEQEQLYQLARQEFGTLRHTPGAPLEYLGKALVYQIEKDYEEEVKCFELALRRYKNHPLLSILEEEIVFRMHESAREMRLVAYQFILLVSRYLPSEFQAPATVKLVANLKKHWEIPPFFVHVTKGERSEAHYELERAAVSLHLAFWLAKPYVLYELLQELLQRPVLPITYIADSIFLIIELGAISVAEKAMRHIRELLSPAEQERYRRTFDTLDLDLQVARHHFPDITHLFKGTLVPEEERFLWFALRTALDTGASAAARQVVDVIERTPIAHFDKEALDALVIEYYLHEGDTANAERVFRAYPRERFSEEGSPLYFLWGVYLAATTDSHAALTHYSQVFDEAFARSWLLGAHFLTDKLHNYRSWSMRAFLWEKRALSRELALFYHVVKDVTQEQSWREELGSSFHEPA